MNQYELLFAAVAIIVGGAFGRIGYDCFGGIGAVGGAIIGGAVPVVCVIIFRKLASRRHNRGSKE